MRKIILVAVVCAFVAVPVLADPPHGAFSDSATMDYTRLTNYFSGNGGEFTLSQYMSQPYLSNAAYASVAKAQDGDSTSFQTFCMEQYEYVAQPMTFYVSEQNAALTAAGSHAWKGGTGIGDDLDPRTAYLYTKFATGTLTGYDYSVAGRATSAGALQNAIWFIEGEGGVSNSFVALADTAVAVGGEWYGKGIGNVRVIQAYKLDGSIAQDQLYFVPVPGAVLLGFLGLGYAGTKLRRFV